MDSLQNIELYDSRKYRNFFNKDNYFSNNDFPFIAIGTSSDIISKMVGAISANLPSFNLKCCSGDIISKIIMFIKRFSILARII